MTPIWIPQKGGKQLPVVIKSDKVPPSVAKESDAAANSRRSQSCELLSSSSSSGGVAKDGSGAGKRWKRRCPTPPRVLSPSMDNMKCEVIADI
jgi:hypothetical protein